LAGRSAVALATTISHEAMHANESLLTWNTLASEERAVRYALSAYVAMGGKGSRQYDNEVYALRYSVSAFDAYMKTLYPRRR
jgi:hypothetical protein